MGISQDSTIAEIKALPVDQQLEALATIWDDIASQEKASLTKEERDILDFRLSQDHDKPGIDWEILKSTILASLK